MNYYLDIETTGLDELHNKIITIQYMELERNTAKPAGPLKILKEWESDEKTILTEFISNSGINAHREETSDASSVISRRTAKMMFISEVVSALEQYPEHAHPITKKALSIGKLSRVYIAHAIINHFPGYTKIVSEIFF